MCLRIVKINISCVKKFIANKIYSLRYVHYRFAVNKLAINFGTQP